MHVSKTEVKSILTRSSGYLRTVCSHSLQGYRGCSYGRTLCGVGCYVQHNPWLTRGETWGSFLEIRVNAAEQYRRQQPKERAWAEKSRGTFTIFMSSSTDPFLPHEDRFCITRKVLEAMLEKPPDSLILQSHSHRAGMYLELCQRLAERCELRFHLSIESDRDRLNGLPPPASSVAARLEAAARLRAAGLRVVITMAPLLPIEDPPAWFARVAQCADAVVLDHFIGGDGSKEGQRTLRTPLPAAIAAVDPACLSLRYRDEMVQLARKIMPGRVGIGISGFGGNYG